MENNLTVAVSLKSLTEVNLKYHYVYGVVYSPLQIDTDWETISSDDVVKMAHDFVASGQSLNIDVGHNRIQSGAEIVESFIARKDDPDYEEGSWVLGVRIPEDELWEQVKSGELNGFSVDFTVTKVPKKVIVDIAKIAIGKVEQSTVPDIITPHDHEYYVDFDSEGRVLLGFTSVTLNHKHTISGTVVTDETLGHTHRFFVD